MSRREVRVSAIESDGSDGYSPGTWEGRVHVVDLDDGVDALSYDGGYPSRASALAWARRRAREVQP